MPKGKPNKRYTPEYKIMVVETMHKEKLSYKEAARQFNVSYDTVVAGWNGFILRKAGTDCLQNEEEEKQQDRLKSLRKKKI